MTIYDMPPAYIHKELSNYQGDAGERRLELDLEALLTGPTSAARARHLSTSIVRQGARAVAEALRQAVKRFDGLHKSVEPWCEPYEAGLSSEAKAVGKRLGELLTALSGFDNIVKGTLPHELWQYRIALHERLKAEGWRITGTANGWKVLPPKR